MAFEFVERAPGERVTTKIAPRRDAAGTDAPPPPITATEREPCWARSSSGRRATGFLVLLATCSLSSAASMRSMKTPLDALPDLSDVQVIIYTEYPGQAPQVVEDQVTYPLTTAMLVGAEVEGRARLLVLRRVVRLRDLRGRHRHLLGAHARARVPELRRRPAAQGRVAAARSRRDRRRLGLPVRAGWREQTLAELRTIQDWYLRYQLTKAHGVAEVASSAASCSSTRSSSIP